MKRRYTAGTTKYGIVYFDFINFMELIFSIFLQHYFG